MLYSKLAQSLSRRSSLSRCLLYNGRRSAIFGEEESGSIDSSRLGFMRGYLTSSLGAQNQSKQLITKTYLSDFNYILANPKFRRFLSSEAPKKKTKLDGEGPNFAKVIDGKAVAKQIRDEISIEVSRMKEAIGVVPGLAVILVGERKDSTTNVRNKKKACQAVGITSFEVCLPDDATEQEVLKCVSDFNDDPEVHGILVQLPLPSA